MQSTKKLSQVVSRQFVRKASYEHGHHHGPVSTYNDLPTPQGSWKTHYDANQRKYNSHLAIGIGSVIGTIIFGRAAGFFEFYNDYPERPATIESYKN